MTAIAKRIPTPATRNPFLFYTYVTLNSGEALVYVLSGVSAADAALKAAYTAVREGYAEHAKPLQVRAETSIYTLNEGVTWSDFEGTVTPTGRTFNR
tara:strand:- start:2754 stop:3044 length:291 start_codon:yes stop_codon:yes gene_type:complete